MVFQALGRKYLEQNVDALLAVYRTSCANLAPAHVQLARGRAAAGCEDAVEARAAGGPRPAGLGESWDALTPT